MMRAETAAALIGFFRHNDLSGTNADRGMYRYSGRLALGDGFSFEYDANDEIPGFTPSTRVVVEWDDIDIYLSLDFGIDIGERGRRLVLSGNGFKLSCDHGNRNRIDWDDIDSRRRVPLRLESLRHGWPTMFFDESVPNAGTFREYDFFRTIDRDDMNSLMELVRTGGPGDVAPRGKEYRPYDNMRITVHGPADPGYAGFYQCSLVYTSVDGSKQLDMDGILHWYDGDIEVMNGFSSVSFRPDENDVKHLAFVSERDLAARTMEYLDSHMPKDFSEELESLKGCLPDDSDV